MNITNPEWPESSEKIIQRICANLKIIAKIDSTVFVKYDGPESAKTAVYKAYRENLPKLNSLISSIGGTHIVPLKEESEVKLKWLESLIKEFQPTGIKFSLN